MFSSCLMYVMYICVYMICTYLDHYNEIKYNTPLLVLYSIAQTKFMNMQIQVYGS